MFATYIQPLIVHYGCWAVFFVVMFEATGLPLPGESALVLAGVYAGATGNLAIANVIVAAAAGAIIGDNFGFWIGRRFGVRLLERFGKFVCSHPKPLIARPLSLRAAWRQNCLLRPLHRDLAGFRGTSCGRKSVSLASFLSSMLRAE